MKLSPIAVGKLVWRETSLHYAEQFDVIRNITSSESEKNKRIACMTIAITVAFFGVFTSIVLELIALIGCWVLKQPCLQIGDVCALGFPLGAALSLIPMAIVVCEKRSYDEFIEMYEKADNTDKSDFFNKNIDAILSCVRDTAKKDNICNVNVVLDELYSPQTDWMAELLSLFSCGRSESTFATIEHYEKQKCNSDERLARVAATKMKSEYAKGIEELDDLLTIWSRIPNSSGIMVNMGALGTNMNDYVNLSSMLGVDSMFDAYYAGVPVEDIVA